MAASFITSQGGGRRSEVGSRKYLGSEFRGLYPTLYEVGGGKSEVGSKSHVPI